MESQGRGDNDRRSGDDEPAQRKAETGSGQNARRDAAAQQAGGNGGPLELRNVFGTQIRGPRGKRNGNVWKRQITLRACQGTL